MNILNNRASGVLMAISSLPGDFGIGTLGKNAYDFVDFLEKAGQTYWQILPVGPTGYGDSPYQSFSTFAGNPYFIDFKLVQEDGFLKASDYKNIDWGSDPTHVDYGKLYVERHKVFAKLQENFCKNPPADYETFCQENAAWLDDYALFMAVKDDHNGAAFITWEEDIRLRRAAALRSYEKKCADRIHYYKILQYFFYKQWKNLKAYANGKGIYIIGDIPIYVSADSSDVWTNPKNFLLDEKCIPLKVAGCPPDAFTDLGQLWGNPVYDWPALKKNHYDWWKKRIAAALRLYDVIRIDHFRGFESFYTINYGAENAKAGEWMPGPGLALFDELKKEFGDLPIIAEDLGFLTDEVKVMLKDSGFPGMKVLQFGYNPDGTSEYLPYRFLANSVVYTGTHDNDTINGWLKTGTEPEVKYAQKFLRAATKGDIRSEMMLAALACVSNTCILTMQDLIGLGSEARMNTPSVGSGNWQWRAEKGQITAKIASDLKKYTELYGR